MNFEKQIFEINNDADFEKLALSLFHYQYLNNAVYQKYVDLLKIKPDLVTSVEAIPCMPVSFFKNHTITSGSFTPELEFYSSKTTGQQSSVHYIKSAALYEKSLMKGFEQHFGKLTDYSIFALLPSYLERENASLVYMVDTLIKATKKSTGGFYLYNHQQLVRDIKAAQSRGENIILWGVSFALLDLAEDYSGQLKNIRIIETGGMKGRRKELTRKELHDTLKEAFTPVAIDSEYGMTELLSQAWSINETPFKSPAWLKIFIRDTYDPRNYLTKGQQGLINVIDLANIHSCAFLETNDLGIMRESGFEVLGRFDQSEIRGCNLMIES